MPRQNAEFWKTKFERNIKRDAQKVHELEALGWRVVIVWQCETNKTEALSNRLCELLRDVSSKSQ